MPKIIKRHILPLFFILLSQICDAQELSKNQRYRGIFLGVGQINVNSLSPLNQLLQATKLPAFETKLFHIKYGYDIINKYKMYVSVRMEFSNQSQSNNDYNLRFNSTQFGVSLGYKVFDKKGFSLIPNIGVNAGSLLIDLVENNPATANKMDFKDAILASKTQKSNTLILPQVSMNLSLIGIYKIKIGDEEEQLEGGKVITQRWIPVGFELGYKSGKELNNWVSTSEVTNGPLLDFSGLFFAIRINTMAKVKSIKQ